MNSTIHISKFMGRMILIWIIMGLSANFSCNKLDEEIAPRVNTGSVTRLEDGSYEISASLTFLGNEEITEHGICWSESALPNIDGASTKLGPLNQPGEFVSIINGLDGYRTYYARAYVEANSVTYYGNQKAFMVELNPENRVTDIDGNIYRTIKIGEQTWMAENLKVTKYPDGTPIQHLADHDAWYDMTRESMAYCWYDNLKVYGHNHGALYTWKAAVNGQDSCDLNPSEVQGVCPDGWHVPSDSEWKQLELHLGMNEEEVDMEDWRGPGTGGKLKLAGTNDWLSPNSGATGETGFNARPGGFRHGSADFLGRTTTTRFWTTTKPGYSYAWFRQLDYDNSSIGRNFEGVYRGHSVRCVKDE